METANTATTAGGMTLQRKQELSAQINEMNMNSLSGVVEILMRHLPDLKTQAGSEIKIDLDGLAEKVLRELERYCEHDKKKQAAAAADGPPTKKARTTPKVSKKELKQKEKKLKDEQLREQKMHILAGCERVLRAAGAPKTGMELVFAGTDAGYFHLRGSDVDKTVQKVLQDDIKAGSHASFVFQGGKFMLSEWTMPEEQKQMHVTSRQAYLSSLPVFAEPATPEQAKMLRAHFVLSKLAKGPYQQYHPVFAEPVDAVTLGLLDYHDVIKEPMDTGTIRQRLNDGVYQNFAEFQRDLNLVWSNAMTYNPPNDPVHKWAKDFQAQTHALYGEFGLV